MPLPIESIDQMKNYLIKLMERADHHAKEVEAVCLSLVGAIIWKANKVEVRTYKGDMANQLWMMAGANWYSFTYGHESGTVDMKKDNHHGDVIHTFTNTSSAIEILSIFDKL